jgi:hypothetical protein
MSDATTEGTEAKATKKAGKGGSNKMVSAKAGKSRKTIKKLGREKRYAKLRADKEFATAYFDGRSKRSDQKKVAFRKRHTVAK